MNRSKEGCRKINQIFGDGSILPLVGSKRRRQTFDVFISFRGEDTRRSFTSHLSSALFKKGVNVFHDDRIERGDEISEVLREAIAGSKVSLVVFSENYASSRWCLEELVEILQCKKTMDQLVIPIFYDVDPSQVRWQKQSFAVAFERHKEKYKDNTEKVNQWRSALHEAANLSGHDSSEWTPNPDNGLVGIDSRMEKVLRLLEFGEEDIRIVGIWGMGGIGKTTLAEAVFDQISGDFEGSYFFRSVRETEVKGGLVEKRNESLSVILGEDIHIGTSMLPSFVVDRLRRKRVLAVLDDVNHQRQLEILFKGLAESGAGSRVIITTRDRHVLTIFTKDKVKVYDMEGLNNDEALRLFYQNAYISEHQIEAYDELHKKVVHYASGIPLALKVFARSLRGKDRQVGNCLEKDRQRQDKDEVATLLDGCYHAVHYGLSVLEDKALITIRRNKIEMSDPLQELGGDIVKQECESEPGRRTLVVGVGELSPSFSSLCMLSHLNLSYCDSLKSLPGDIWKMQALKELLLYDCPKLEEIPEVLERNECLEEIFLTGAAIRELPSSIERLLRLERLWLNDCRNLSVLPETLWNLDNLYSFRALRASIRQLPPFKKETTKLTDLRISGYCYSLDPVPLLVPPLSRVRSLETLEMSNLHIEQIPENIGCLTSLMRLDLSGNDFKSLPATIKHLSVLYELDLSCCRRLESLYEDIGCLTSLRRLRLSGNDFQILHPIIKHLSKLEMLDLSYCRNLESLSQDIGCLTSLRNLDLSGNGFRILPACMKYLSNVEILDLSYDEGLGSVPKFPNSLRNFNAHECASLGTTCGNMEFFAGAFGGNYIFNHCLRLQEDVTVKRVAAAKLLFQTLEQKHWVGYACS
ncbi:PREDICTED: TMV resistance protein N-like [Tarenaya hassleriana]|uniref:TMV resistance protein N-like n=1 Tax=Tarenaya hassleriana TaxID=28532 RepID=UPI00053C4B4E|nr:PREDICTED: TMV resistance protein N-like [Tarenaya hassleriana]